MNKPDGSAIIRIVGGSDSEEWEPTPEQIDVIVSAYQKLDFRAFLGAYNDLIARARKGGLGPKDFEGTTNTAAEEDDGAFLQKVLK